MTICHLCEEEIKGESFSWTILTEPYPVCKECREFLDEEEAQGDLASRFWEEYDKAHQSLPHICDFSIEELKEKHRNVLNLCKKYDKQIVGLYLGAECYSDIWASRSCSGHMARLVGIESEIDPDDGADNSYCWFYCQSSSYYIVKMLYHDKEFEEDFRKAMESDGYDNLPPHQ
jgi:hypothetical protein